jgi:hypothetical protein
MPSIPVTPIENLLVSPNPAPPPISTRAQDVRAQEVPAATCIDAAGHVISCSVCKRVSVLERALLVLVSAVVASLLTLLVVWRVRIKYN